MPALRSSNGTTDLHKNTSLAATQITPRLSRSYSIPRRHPGLGVLLPRRYPSSKQNHLSLTVTRFCPKHRQMSPHSQHQIHLARDRLGYPRRPLENSSRKSDCYTRPSTHLHQHRPSVPAAMGKTPGHDGICLPSSPANEGALLPIGGSTSHRQHSRKRQAQGSPRSLYQGTSPMDQCPSTGKIFALHAHQTRADTLDGRLKPRVGRFDLRQQDSTGNLVGLRSNTSHQYPGNTCNRKIRPKSSAGQLSNKSHDRQRDGAICSKPKRQQITHDTPNGVASAPHTRKKTDQDSARPHPVVTKRSSRRAQPPDRSSNRVVPVNEGLPDHTAVARSPSSRSDGDSSERTSPNLRLSVPTSSSGRIGCPGSKLAPMEPNIPIPSEEFHREPDPKARGVPSPRRHDHTRSPVSPVVSDHQEAVQEGPIHPARPTPEGPGRDSLSELRELDRLEFLRVTWSRLHGDSVASKLVEAQRPSTSRQFQSAWTSFQKWLAPTTTEISKQTVLEYLLYLQDSRKLQPRTILVHRAALSLPLSLGFKIETSDKEFGLLAKAQFLSKPPLKPALPSWSLNRALESLSSPPFKHPKSPEHLLLKTLFLVALASGNRVSELAACTRSGATISNIRTTLSVRRGFLFKNQTMNHSPPPITFPSIDMRHPLCPARALRDYIDRTEQLPHNGCLFVHPTSGHPLKAGRLSYWLWKAIETTASPTTKFGGHDLRKLGHSVAWIRGVPTEDILKNGFWQSPNVFTNNYCTNLLVPSKVFVAGRTLVN